MSWSAKIRRTPLRLATGAFIVNSGIDHLKVDEETQGQLHEMAAGTYPFLRKVDPRLFSKALAVPAVTALLQDNHTSCDTRSESLFLKA